MNIVGRPPFRTGLTISALPTELNAFTKRAEANSRCRRSINDSSREVKYRRTPWSGGASAMGLVVSMMTLAPRFTAPARRSASAAAAPFTARTRISPCDAASAKLPTRASGCCVRQSASLPGSRVPSVTSCPYFRKPAASVRATTLDPRIPIRIRRLCTCPGHRAASRAAVDAFIEFLDHFPVERGNVVRLPRRDDATIDDDLLVHPFCSGVLEIHLHRRPRGHRDAADHISLDESPRAMANDRNRLSVIEEPLYELNRARIHTQPIRIHDTARKKQRVVFIGTRLFERAIDLHFIAPLLVFPSANPAGLR